ncbi:MAG: hypothetical protein K5673_05870 [Lachnospiraceae bacterium]|nr:hypothetical protein [Lachnospiraceae bacterium]
MNKTDMIDKTNNMSMANRVILLILIFGVLLIWPVWWMVRPLMDTASHENRQLSERPVLNAESYTGYSHAYESYLNDRLPFRNALVSLNSFIDYYVFKEASDSSVIIGRDGWLFFSDTVEDYQRYNMYSEEELADLAAEAEALRAYCDSHGITFILFMPPNKNSVYGEYMPAHITAGAGPSRADQYVSYLREHTGVDVIWVRDELVEAATGSDRLLYMKHDSHWNGLGSYIGSRLLMSHLGVNMSAPGAMAYTHTDEAVFAGAGHDLANAISMDAALGTDENFVLSGYVDESVYDSIEYRGDYHESVSELIDPTAIDGDLYVLPDNYMGVNPYGDVVYASSDAADSRRVLFARDSFGEMMTQYLAAGFADVISIRNSTITIQDIDEIKPDILIYEMVERSDYYDLGSITSTD